MGKNLDKALLSLLKEETEEPKVESTNSMPAEISSGLEIWSEDNINTSLTTISATADYPEEEINEVKTKILELSGSLKNALESIEWENVDLETMPKLWAQGTDGWNLLSQVDTSTLESYVQEVIDWAENQNSEESEENENPVKYEESIGFSASKKMVALTENSEFDLKDFNNYPIEVLEEYAFSKGFEFTTKKETLTRLLESGRVTKSDLNKFYENFKKELLENTLMDNVNVLDFPEELDFRNIQHMLSFTEDDPEYELLTQMTGEAWENYVSTHFDSGIEIKYDSMNDKYLISPYTEELEEGERYEVEEEDKQIVENIIKSKKYKLVECRGSLKKSGKETIMEILIEKDGHQTKIQYDDAAISKPWRIGYNEFNLLQEALNSIYIPFKKLVNETVEANKKTSKAITLLEKIQRQSSNKTQDLPLSEKERRELRGAEITRKMFGEDIIPSKEENTFPNQGNRLA